jgi:two-component system sensor histidine kinase QseC
MGAEGTETGGDPAGRELRRLTEEISSLREEHRRFVHSVSHYLKAPLTALLGFSAFLVEELEGDRNQDILHYVRRISENSRLMERMIDDLVFLSRLEKKEGGPCGLRVAVEAALAGLEDSRERESVSVSVQPDAPDMPLPRDHAVEIMSRLLSNAVRYSPPGADVRVGFRDGEFTVRDGGKGMKPDVLRRAFDLFFTTADKREGRTGGGLYIARAIAVLYGGTLRAESRSGGPTSMCLRIGSSA